MRTATRLALTLLTATAMGCVEGPAGPTGPEGPEGPRGEPGVPPTAAEVSADLVTNHLETIRGPQGDPGTPPTAAEVAADLAVNYADTLRGPAGAFNAFDANGTEIGRVTGLEGWLWSEAAQGFFWRPGLLVLGPDRFLNVGVPPGAKLFFVQLGCSFRTGEIFWDPADEGSAQWLEPLIVSSVAGGGLFFKASWTAPRANATVASVLEPDGTCTDLAIPEARTDLVVFLDAPASPGALWAPMTLRPTTVP